MIYNLFCFKQTGWVYVWLVLPIVSSCEVLGEADLKAPEQAMVVPLPCLPADVQRRRMPIKEFL